MVRLVPLMAYGPRAVHLPWHRANYSFPSALSHHRLADVRSSSLKSRLPQSCAERDAPASTRSVFTLPHLDLRRNVTTAKPLHARRTDACLTESSEVDLAAMWYTTGYRMFRAFLLQRSSDLGADIRRDLFALDNFIRSIRERGCQATTVVNYYRGLKAFFQDLERRDGIPSPFHGHRAPTMPSRVPKARSPRGVPPHSRCCGEDPVEVAVRAKARSRPSRLHDVRGAPQRGTTAPSNIARESRRGNALHRAWQGPRRGQGPGRIFAHLKFHTFSAITCASVPVAVSRRRNFSAGSVAVRYRTPRSVGPCGAFVALPVCPFHALAPPWLRHDAPQERCADSRRERTCRAYRYPHDGALSSRLRR